MLPGIDLRSSYQCCYRGFAIGAFVMGLVLKTPLLCYLMRPPRLKAAMAAIAMTAAWWMLDVPVILCASIAGVLLWSRMLSLDENDALWVSIILIAPMIRAALETFLLRWACSFRAGKKAIYMLFLANELCIVAAMCGLILYFRAHPAIA